jgi:acyl-CoA thioesterase-1
MRRAFLLALLSTGIAACSIRDAACGKQFTPEQAAATEQAHATATGSGTITIAFLGDSLTEGLGLLMNEAYPVLIQNKFQAAGYTNVEIVNGGVSGDTTAGGLRRVDDLLTSDVKILVVALGGNDALRGLPVDETRNNLAKIVDAALAKGVRVLLAGMEVPPNLGEDYQLAFRQAFLQAALKSRDIVFVPFLLEGVAAKPELNQADGIHPNKQGAAIIADNLYPKLKTMVDLIGGGG